MRLRDLGHRLFDVWMYLQVELNGHYSVARMHALQGYKSSTSMLRVILVTALSPFPCLMLITLIDCIPLAAWTDGPEANYTFWGRQYITVGIITRAILAQLQLSVPGLHMTGMQAGAMTALATLGGVGTAFGLAIVVGFPVPFTLVAGTPCWFVVLVVAFAIFFGGTLKADRALRHELFNQIVIISCQVVLTFIYPAYLYGFRSVDSTTQTFYVLLLPIIKIITKNWISFFMGKKDDLKPQVVILNVEVFNALYVASSMQNSTSISTTMALFLVDFVLAWISINDVNNLLGDITVLLKRIPAGHPLKSMDFVDIALQILDEDPNVSEEPSLATFSFELRRKSEMKLTSAREATEGTTSGVNKSLAWSNRVVPFGTSIPVVSVALPNTVDSGRCASFGDSSISPRPRESALKNLFSAEERLRIVRKTAQVLFTTEFVILIEYTEVIIPFIYSIYVGVMFQLPNRVYYPQIRELDEDSIVSTIGNVVVYGTIELLSFLAMSMLLKRKIGISTLYQLAFILDREWRMVQANLFLWISYTIQNSLDHNGADFSWQFRWLKDSSFSGPGLS